MNKDSLTALDRDISMGMSTLEAFDNGGMEVYNTIESQNLQLPPLVLQSTQPPAQPIPEAMRSVPENGPDRSQALPGVGEVVSESEDDTYKIYNTEELIAETPAEAVAPLNLHCVYEEEEKNKELIARIMAEGTTQVDPSTTALQAEQPYDGFVPLAVPSFLDTSPNTSSLMQQDSSGMEVKRNAPINDRISPDVPDVLNAPVAVIESNTVKEERKERTNEGSPIFHDSDQWRASMSCQRNSVDVSSISAFSQSSYESLEGQDWQLRNGAMAADKYDFSADDQSETKMESYTRPSFLQEDDMDLADWRNHPSRFPSYNGKDDGD